MHLKLLEEVPSKMSANYTTQSTGYSTHSPCRPAFLQQKEKANVTPVSLPLAAGLPQLQRGAVTLRNAGCTGRN